MDSNGESAVLASSYSTGGGGFTFERRVAVRYLAAMLSGAPRQELGDRRVVRVSFQQSSVSPVDDVHVLGARDEEIEPSMELWVAARRRPKFVRSDPLSQELVASLVEAAALPEEPGRDRRLVVCAAGHENRAALKPSQRTVDAPMALVLQEVRKGARHHSQPAGGAQRGQHSTCRRACGGPDPRRLSRVSRRAASIDITAPPAGISSMRSMTPMSLGRGMTLLPDQRASCAARSGLPIGRRFRHETLGL